MPCAGRLCLAETAAELVIEIQEGKAGEWHRVIDTSLESPQDILEPHDQHLLPTLHYTVAARSVVVLLRKGAGEKPG